jgi:hypothetical protein
VDVTQGRQFWHGGEDVVERCDPAWIIARLPS